MPKQVIFTRKMDHRDLFFGFSGDFCKMPSPVFGPLSRDHEFDPDEDENDAGSKTRAEYHQDGSPSMVSRDVTPAPQVLTLESVYNLLKGLESRIGRLEGTIGNLYHMATEANTTTVETSSVAPTNTIQPQLILQNFSLKLRDLDDLCLPLFTRKPNPSTVELNQLVRAIERNYPRVEKKKMLSVIRRWFRKRRDDNGQKVFAACISVLVPLIEQGLPVDGIQRSVRERDQLYSELAEQASIEITNAQAAHEFLLEKIKSFIDRRIQGRRLIS